MQLTVQDDSNLAASNRAEIAEPITCAHVSRNVTARPRGGAMQMLVARYFFFVGAALLALLFIADANLPKSAPLSTADMSSDLSAIRIKTDRKWPAQVVFDTRVPEPTAVQTANNAPPASVAAASGSSAAGSVTDVNTGKPVAELTPSESRQSEMAQADVKPRESRRPLKRKIAKRRSVEPTVLASRQAPFGFFTNNIW